LLAPLGIDAEGLARTAWHLQRQRRVLARAMDELARCARHWGGFGEVRLDVAALAGDEPDTALRLLADSLLRVSGAVYRPRFRALSEALDSILSGQDAALTLSGCLIRPNTGTVLICREPGACEAMRPLEAGTTVWDRRWEITVSGGWPASAQLGALGEQGLGALRTGEESGAWIAADSWASAPRAVRQTTPAVWLGVAGAMPKLLAAPLARFLNQRTIGPGCAILAENTATKASPWASLPTYGRAGVS